MRDFNRVVETRALRNVCFLGCYYENFVGVAIEFSEMETTGGLTALTTSLGFGVKWYYINTGMPQHALATLRNVLKKIHRAAWREHAVATSFFLSLRINVKKLLANERARCGARKREARRATKKAGPARHVARST